MNNLKAIKREILTSGSNNKLRSEGFIPAILYGGNNSNQSISISKKEISNIINSDTFLSKVLEIEIDGKLEKVIPRDVAYHAVSEEPIHIDFMRIISGKKIILEIPVKFINHPDSPGLKRGGVLNIVRRKVELKCPGENIPDEIVIDLNLNEINCTPLQNEETLNKRRNLWKETVEANGGTHPSIGLADTRLLNRMRRSAVSAVYGAGMHPDRQLWVSEPRDPVMTEFSPTNKYRD